MCCSIQKHWESDIFPCLTITFTTAFSILDTLWMASLISHNIGALYSVISMQGLQVFCQPLPTFNARDSMHTGLLLAFTHFLSMRIIYHLILSAVCSSGECFTVRVGYDCCNELMNVMYHKLFLGPTGLE